MPTNSERPQRRMTTGTVVSRALVEARETPQARRDPTVGNAEWMQAYQGGFKPLSGNFATGLPGDVPSPAQLGCMLMTDTTIVDMSWDPVGRTLFVGTAGSDFIEVWRENGLYWERIDRLDPPDLSTGIGFVSAYNGGVIASFTQGQFYWPDWRDKPTVYKLRNPKAVAVHANGLVTDSTDDWPAKVTTSYQTETVPTGTYKGFYVDESAAIADGAEIGDWYYNTTSDNWQEITGVGASANNLIQYSEDLTNAVWSEIRCTADDAITLREDATAANTHYVRQDSIPFGEHTLTATLTPLERRFAFLGNNAFVLDAGVIFNLDTGQATNVGANVITYSSTAEPNGAWRCSVTVDITGGNDFFDVALCESGTTNNYDGDNTSRIQVERMQCTAVQYAPDQLVDQWNFNAGNRRIFLDTFNEKSTRLLTDTFTSSNRVFTDNFNRVNPAPWQPGAAALLSIETGEIKVENGAGGFGTAFYTFTAEVGKWYRFKATGRAELAGSSWTLKVRAQSGGAPIVELDNPVFGTTATDAEFTWQADTADIQLELFNNVVTAGQNCWFDDIVIEEVGGLQGWNSVGSALIEVRNDAMYVENTIASEGRATKQLTTIAGRQYRLRGNRSDGNVNGRVWAGTAQNLNDLLGESNVAGVFDFTFTATGTETWITLGTQASSIGDNTTWDNITVDELPLPNNWIEGNRDQQLAVADGWLQVWGDSVGASPAGFASREFSLDVNQWHKATITGRAVTSGGQIRIGNSLQGFEYSGLVGVAGGEQEYSFTFKPTQPQVFIGLWVGDPGLDQLCEYTDVLVEEVPALEGWNAGGQGTLARVSNELEVTNGAADFGRATQNVTTVAGTAYVATGKFTRVDNSGLVRIGTTGSGNDLLDYNMVADEIFSQPFVATTTTSWLSYWNNSNTAANTSLWDNIAISTAKALVPDYVATTDADASTVIRRAGSPNFPDKFVIDALAGDVVIYEINDGVPTMWMVFEQGGGFDATNQMIGAVAQPIVAIDYQDGELQSVTNGSGIHRISFVADNCVRLNATESRPWNGTISQRNEQNGETSGQGGAAIVNTTVNDVASTVLSQVDTTNLLSQTEQLDTWAGIGSLTLTEVAPPDDASEAWEINSPGSNNFARVELVNTGFAPLATNDRIVHTCYVRQGSNGRFAHRLEDRNGTGNTATTSYQFVNGVPQFVLQDTASLATYVTSYYREVDGGWWRISTVLDVVASTTGDLSQLLYPSFGVGVPALLYATAVQLEKSANPHAYVPSVTGPTTGQTPPAKQLRNRTNLITHSNDFIDPAWPTNGDGAVEVAEQVSPPVDVGTVTVFTASQGVVNYIRQFVNPAAGIFTASFYARKRNQPNIGLRVFRASGNDAQVSVSLDTGEILSATGGTGRVVQITDAGDGWWRIALTTDEAVTGAPDFRITASGTFGDADAYICAAQWETGGYKTPYIDTTADERYGLIAANNDYWRTPDDPRFNRNGNTRVDLKVQLDDYASGSPQYFCAKALLAGDFRFDFSIIGTGEPRFRPSVDGTTIPNTPGNVAVPFANGTVGYIRVERNENTGDITYFTSTDGETYTQLGSVVSGPAGPLFDGNELMSVGAQPNGNNAAIGRIYMCDVYAGTRLISRFDPADFKGSTFTSEAGDEWAAQGNAVITSDSTAITVTDDYGLFIPDWAVATDGGLSNGRDDGNVWDITGQTNQLFVTGYTQNEQIVYGEVVASVIALYDPLEADVTFSAFASRYYSTANLATEPTAPKILNDDGGRITSMAVEGPQPAFTDGVEGLTLIEENTSDFLKGEYTHITDGYNTGPMFEPLGAWANQATVGGGPTPGPTPDFQGTLVAGTNGTWIGFNDGTIGAAQGSLTPAQIEVGIDFIRLYRVPSGPTRYEIALTPDNLAATYWDTIEVTGITDPGWAGGTQTFIASATTYTASLSGATFWTDENTTVPAMVVGDSYDVKLYRPSPFYTATMTAGSGASSRTGYYDGANNGSIGGPFGSITSTAINLSVPTSVAGVFHLASGFNEWDFSVTGNYGVATTEFSQIYVRGVTDPNFFINLDAAASTRIFASGETTWRWSLTTPYVVGDQYLVEVY